MHYKSSTILIFLFILANFLPAQNEPPVLIYRDKIRLDEISYSKFNSLTHFPNEGNLIALNEEEAMVQLGSVLIGLMDLKTGKLKQNMDLYRLEALISKSLSAAKGEAHCVSGREDFSKSRVRPKTFGIQFDRILKYPDESSFATLTHVIVINQNNSYEREIFTGVLIFDNQLKPLNFLPLTGLEKISSPPSIRFGGWFYNGFLFTKVSNVYNNLSYEFIKFERNKKGQFEFVDTLTYWPSLDIEISHGSRFFGMQKVEGQYNISLGNQIIIAKSLSDSGTVVQPAIKDNQYLLNFEPLQHSDWMLTLVAENIQSGRNLKAIFSFINKDYSLLSPRLQYQLLEVQPLSMTTFGHQIYLLMYDHQNKYFYIEHLEYQ